MTGAADYARLVDAARARYRAAGRFALGFARGHGATRLHCRSVAQWRSALEALEFNVRTVPMSRGTPIANVLLCAHCNSPARP